MGLRVSLVELYRPLSPARPPKTEPTEEKPVGQGGFRDYYNALASPHRPPSPSGGDPTSPPVSARKPDSDASAEESDASGAATAETDTQPMNRSGAPPARPKAVGDAKPAPPGSKDKLQAGEQPADAAEASVDAQNAGGEQTAQALVSILPAPAIASGPLDAHTSEDGDADAQAAVSNTPVAAGSSVASTATRTVQVVKSSGVVGIQFPAFQLNPSLSDVQVAAKLADDAPTANVTPAQEPVSPFPPQSADDSSEPANREAILVGVSKTDTAATQNPKTAPIPSPARAPLLQKAMGEAQSDKSLTLREHARTSEVGPRQVAQETASVDRREPQTDGEPANGGSQGGEQSSSSRPSGPQLDAPSIRRDAAVIKSDGPAPPTSIAVRTASGDRVAADIGRFLVSEGSHVTTDSATATQAPVVLLSGSPVASAAHATAHPVVQSQAASTVADILGAGIASSSPTDVAARVLSTGSGQGSHQATLQLDPPELGQMRIDIRLREHAITLRIDADDSAAARMIESRLPELKDALAVHGIRVERCEVTLRPPEASHGNASHDEGRRSSGDANPQAQQQSSAWFDDGRRSGGTQSGRPQEDQTLGVMSSPPGEQAATAVEWEPGAIGSIAVGGVNLVA